jgi:hypothetical protein
MTEIAARKAALDAAIVALARRHNCDPATVAAEIAAAMGDPALAARGVVEAPVSARRVNGRAKTNGVLALPEAPEAGKAAPPPSPPDPHGHERAAEAVGCCMGYRRQCSDCVWHPNADKAMRLASLRRASTMRRHKGRVAAQFLKFRSRSGWRPADGRQPVRD